jgi:hypothetical protein
MKSISNIERLDVTNGGETRDAQISNLLEQYRLYVEMSESLANRRQNSNSFFLTLLSGLFAATAYFLSKDSEVTLRGLTWLVGVVGIAISAFWRRIIISFAELSKAKFHVIEKLEQGLPVAPFTAEWEHLKEQNPSYSPLTRIEIIVPRLFELVFALLTIWSALLAFGLL